MINRVSLAVSIALLSVSLSTHADIEKIRQSLTNEPINKGNLQHSKAALKQNIARKFSPEQALSPGYYTYIIRLKDLPIATYDGSIKGYSATTPKLATKSRKSSSINTTTSANATNANQIRNALRVNFSAKATQEYANYLSVKQQNFLDSANNVIGASIDVMYHYKNAFNGIAVRLTQAQALQLSTLHDVAYIERERLQTIDTDIGPIHTGATQVWSGDGQNAINMGEGIIIGVLDTGINSDHASFADIGGDGYNHTNPWGTGNYVGDCATNFVELCNDKLIGIRSYAIITNDYDDTTVFGATPPAKNGEDYGGHGSHTASTAGGNILRNIPLVSQDNGAIESDGIENPNFSFAQLSGVAPHANIVAYQVCSPGDEGDTYAGCPTSAIVAALDDAVADGVDIINYSISGGGDPWANATELGFLAAQEAGVFSAVSAGNSGPDAYSTKKNSPWYTAVGASTHGRTLRNFLTFNNLSYSFVEGTGPKLSSVITATPMAASNVDVSNENGCAAFPTDAFKDAIAVIIRGDCDFLDKVNNATAAGALAAVIYNNRDGNTAITMGQLENTTIPAVMISENSGIRLLTDISDNPALALSLDPTIITNIGQADDMADFSSRGPNLTVADIMTPSLTAPGVSIYAAYSDQQFGHDVTGTSPADFAFLNGTSMSAPHVAGAAAILKSVHPSWTADNIRSALMLTASTDVRKEDGTTQADAFDMGSGSIRVNLASNTGLVMDETYANYVKANPSVAGVPASLNIPSMANTKCIDTCSWTRTFVATKDASWTVIPAIADTSTNNMSLSVIPTSFDIQAGEKQSITVTADVSQATADTWNFGDITLTAANTPSARLPVLVQVAQNNLPSEIVIVANRAAGEITYSKLSSKTLSDLNSTLYQAKMVLDEVVSVPDQDVNYATITFADNVPQAIFRIMSDSAPDVDLRILDAAFNTLAESSGSDSNEMVTLVDLPAGTYYAAVDSYTASSPGASDNVTVNVLATYIDSNSISNNVTTTINERESDFDLTFNWSAVNSADGLMLLSSANTDTVTIPWSIVAGEPDVKLSVTDDLIANNQAMIPGVANAISFNIAPNLTNSDKVYSLSATVSQGQEVNNISHDGIVTDNTINWEVTREVGMSTEVASVSFDLVPRTASTANEVTLTNTLGNDTIASSYSFGVAEVAPVAIITGPSSITEGNSATFDASSSFDSNGDDLSYNWRQTSGTTVSINSSASTMSFQAPQVAQNEVLAFQLTVTDINGNENSTTTSLTVIDQRASTSGSGSGSGSMSWLLLLITTLWCTRRKC